MSQNHFEFFRLPVQFDIDMGLLEANFRKIQAEVHPDKFVTASAAERLNSMQTATLANEAYQLLKHPTSRARYLLQLQGIETLEDSNTAMPAEFLMLQMEWRESIEEAESARDIPALEHQLKAMKTVSTGLQQRLSEVLSTRSGQAEAALIVRKLSFIDKVIADVGRIIEHIEE